MKKRDLPSNVYAKGRWYWFVSAEGAKRTWKKLSPIADGLPALYQALSALLRERAAEDSMPGLIADWERDVMPRHAEKTRRDEIARGRVIAEAFADFKAAQVEAPHVAAFLKLLRDKPRTHNIYRAQLRELMRYAVERGLRRDNPVEHLKTMTERARTRYITDSELRRIKVAACYGDDGRRTRSGLMLCALVDMAYLTGQRIGDLLELRWQREADDPDAPHIAAEGVWFRPSKVRGSTGAAVLIEWTPRLRDVVRRLKELKLSRPGTSPNVFTSQEGTGYTYWGASTAWRRAVRRSGVKGVTFHDLRAKALTDKEAREGMAAARTMGAHSTEAQTSDYVRSKSSRKTNATR